MFHRLKLWHGRIRDFSWLGLANVSLVIFTIGYGSVVFVEKYGQRRARKCEHYREALNILDEHRLAMQLLGEPVKCRPVDVWDRARNFVGRYESKFLIPLIGTESDGSLDVLALRETPQQKFRTERLELELHDGTRYLIFERTARQPVEEVKAKPAESKQKRPRLNR